MATIDAAKLRSYNDRYFDVVNIVAEMDDEGVRKALYSKGGGNPSRSKLIENMMRPYSPSFLLPEVSQVIRARPIEGMDPRVAEGIMQAVERRVVPHMQWLAIHKVWERILATSRQWRPEAQAK